MTQALQYLIDGGEGQDGTLTPDVCRQLLYAGPAPSDEEAAGATDDPGIEYDRLIDQLPAQGLNFITGYPKAPFYARIANCLSYWTMTG